MIVGSIAMMDSHMSGNHINNNYMNNKSIFIPAQALVCALKYRDEYTQLHSERVAGLALDLGKKCDLSLLELDILTIAANLHDIGKIGIADNVLLKPGRFEPSEWEEMKTHAEKSEGIINGLAFVGKDIVGKAVRHHHEKFDGTGYPDNLIGEEIPIMSRIISIVDNYDALSEKRSYHSVRTHDEVMKIMQEEAPEKFDLVVFQIFIKLIETSRFKTNTSM